MRGVSLLRAVRSVVRRSVEKDEQRGLPQLRKDRHKGAGQLGLLEISKDSRMCVVQKGYHLDA